MSRHIQDHFPRSAVPPTRLWTWHECLGDGVLSNTARDHPVQEGVVIGAAGIRKRPLQIGSTTIYSVPQSSDRARPNGPIGGLVEPLKVAVIPRGCERFVEDAGSAAQILIHDAREIRDLDAVVEVTVRVRPVTAGLRSRADARS